MRQIRERESAVRSALAAAGITPSAAMLAEQLGLPAPDPSRVGFNDGAFYPPQPPQTHGLTFAAAAAAAPNLAPPATGTRNVLVLLVDFSDAHGTTASSHYDSLLFGTPASGLSMASYYKAASNSQLTVTGKTYGWLRMPQPLTYYTNGQSATGTYPHNGQKLVEDALDAAVHAGVNFAQFDVDGDRSLDGLIVIHAGTGAETVADETTRKNLIWSHKWTISNSRTINGVTVWPYTLQPEDGRVGVFSHEFGHFLGLPDLYDTTYRSEGVGAWCLMGAGSWGGGGDKPSHMSAWCRVKLGWVQPTVVTGHGVAHAIAPAATNGPVVMLRPHGSAPTEYFLLECRAKRTIDADIPGEGLVVWHIDDTVQGNSNPRHYQVGIVQADANQDLEFGANRGDAGDPFPGSQNNKTLSDATNPNARTFAHTNSSLTVDHIGFAAGGSSVKITA